MHVHNIMAFRTISLNLIRFNTSFGAKPPNLMTANTFGYNARSCTATYSSGKDTPEVGDTSFNRDTFKLSEKLVEDLHGYRL